MRPAAPPIVVKPDEGQTMVRRLVAGAVAATARISTASNGPVAVVDEPLALGRHRIAVALRPVLASARDGLATAAGGDLDVTQAGDRAQRAAARHQQAAEASARHAADPPPATHVVNDVAAHPATRITLGVGCIVFEALVTQPALSVVTHGETPFGIRLDYLLAGMFGLLLFACAELAGQLLLTWRAARRGGETPRRGRRPWQRRRVRIARRSPRRFDGLLAATGCVVIVVASLGSLGWLMGVRDHNEKIAAKQIAAGRSSFTTTGIAGLPGSTTAVAGAPVAGGPISGLGGAPAAGGPISGLGAPATSGGGGTAREPESGRFGPIGAASGVAFLLAFFATCLTGAAPERRMWQRVASRLTKEEEAAREAALATETALDAATVGVADRNRGYDRAAVETRRIVEAELRQVEIWNAQIREGYRAACGHHRLTPGRLEFPQLPDIEEEAQRLFGLEFPPGRQTGGYAFGTVPADPQPAEPQPVEPTPATGPPPATEPPPAPGPPPAAEPPARPERPSVKRAVKAVGKRIARMRPDRRARDGDRSHDGGRRHRPPTDHNEPDRRS